MANEFDPYHKWLGIPPREQPADHYRLLGIERFEEDADVISLAGDQRMHFLRSFQNGERAKISQQLLNEVAAARVCLLDQAKKTEYDETLLEKLENNKQAEDQPSQDIAATLEFTTPDSTVDWPAGATEENHSNNLWDSRRESSDSVTRSPASPLTRKTKTRVLIVSLLSGTALLLLMGIVLAAVGGSKKEEAKQSVAENSSNPSSAEDGDSAATEKKRQDRSQVKIEAEQQEKEAKDREAKAIAERQAKAAAKKEKEEADRRAKEEAARRAEAQARSEQIQRRMESLQQRVDQSIQKAERMQYSPDKALEVIRDSLAEVERAAVPPRFKRALRQKLKSVGSEVSRRLAAQREKQEAEERAAWRRENPDEFLETLGLIKQKDAWELEDAVALTALNKPISKLISRYNRQAGELKTKETRRIA